MPNGETNPTPVSLSNPARKEQTERELRRLEKSIAAWLELRRQRDQDEMGKYAGLQQTRLNNLEKILKSAGCKLHRQLALIEVKSLSNEALYDRCRQVDIAVVWLERVWRYYQEKFDQRDDPLLAPLLKAADELVWSCYRQAFIKTTGLPAGWEQKPAPLAYIEPQYSPATWESAKWVPRELRAEGAVEGLEDLVRHLPVPVLRLPPWCIEAPWWLVFVAHEVGHNVSYDLNLAAGFMDGLQKVAQDAGLSENLANHWAFWSLEIFADLYSVLMMGRWAVRAMVEVELSAPASMLQRRYRLDPAGQQIPVYPAPAVRLELMAAAADRLHLNGRDALGGLNPAHLAQGDPAIKEDLALIKPVLDYALGKRAENPDSLELQNRFGPSKSAAQALVEKSGQVISWSTQLQKTPNYPKRQLPTPRYVTCGALAAWEAIAKEAGEGELSDALDHLSTNTLRILEKSGPTGVRAGIKSPAELGSIGENLAESLLNLSRVD